MVNFRPREDRILIKPLERQDSQILHVVTSKRMYRGIVVATGPGRYVNRERTSAFIPLTVKVGDIVSYGETPVIFPEYEEDDTKYLILQEADVAFIEESLG